MDDGPLLPATPRIAVVSTMSGAGKTTLAKLLASRLGVPCIELDALHHLADWQPAPDFEQKVAIAAAQAGWVIDGNYHGRLKGSVTDAADVVLWLDLPVAVCLWRMAKRTARRIVTRKELWNGNRETIYAAVFARDSLFRFALSTYRRRRREMPGRLAGARCVRLRSQAEVNRWLAANLTP